METTTEPATSRKRRPRLSPSGPMRGRRIAAENPKAPTESPTATPPPPKPCSTNDGTTGQVVPNAKK